MASAALVPAMLLGMGLALTQILGPRLMRSTVPKVPASVRMMLNRALPDAAFAGVIKDVAINTRGGMMNGNAQACTSWLGRKSAIYQSLVM